MAKENAVTSQPLGPNDLPKLLSSYQFNGNNYPQWTQLVRTILKGHKKLSHIEGLCPTKSDPGFEAWDVEDALIMTWLWHSMDPKISFNYIFCSTAQEIWDNLAKTYSTKNNIAACYEIESKIFNTKQGGLLVTDYYVTLQALWNKLDQLQSLKMCSDDYAKITEFIEQNRIFKFLSGLNSEYNPIRIQILEKEKLPSLEEVYNIVWNEAMRRYETGYVNRLKRKGISIDSCI